MVDVASASVIVLLKDVEPPDFKTAVN